MRGEGGPRRSCLRRFSKYMQGPISNRHFLCFRHKSLIPCRNAHTSPICCPPPLLITGGCIEPRWVSLLQRSNHRGQWDLDLAECDSCGRQLLDDRPQLHAMGRWGRVFVIVIEGRMSFHGGPATLSYRGQVDAGSTEDGPRACHSGVGKGPAVRQI